MDIRMSIYNQSLLQNMTSNQICFAYETSEKGLKFNEHTDRRNFTLRIEYAKQNGTL